MHVDKKLTSVVSQTHLLWYMIFISVCPVFRKSVPKVQRESLAIRFLKCCVVGVWAWLGVHPKPQLQLHLCPAHDLFGDSMSQRNYLSIKEVLCGIWCAISWTMHGVRFWTGCYQACMTAIEIATMLISNDPEQWVDLTSPLVSVCSCCSDMWPVTETSLCCFTYTVTKHCCLDQV